MSLRFSPSSTARIATLAVCALLGCATVTQQVPRRAGLSPPVTPGTAAKKLLVVLPDSPAALEVLDSMGDELRDEFALVPYFENGQGNAVELGAAVDEVKPTALVLMNNTSVRIFRALQSSRPELPPAVAALTSFLQDELRGLKNVTGIAYEVPVVTQLTRLRLLSAKPLRRVGLVYREGLKDFVAQQAEIARVEQFEVVPSVVTSKPTPRELRAALRDLRKQNVEALVVINDNTLLTPELLADAWLPGVERLGVPVVVGVRGLVNPEVGFATVGLTPDHAALGAQLSSMILDLNDEGWETVDRPVTLPLSVKALVDVRAAHSTLEFDDKALSEFDEVLR